MSGVRPHLDPIVHMTLNPVPTLIPTLLPPSQVSNKLMTEMPADVVPIFMTFSARTSANQTQDIIDAKMDKRRKVWGG